MDNWRDHCDSWKIGGTWYWSGRRISPLDEDGPLNEDGEPIDQAELDAQAEAAAEQKAEQRREDMMFEREDEDRWL